MQRYKEHETMAHFYRTHKVCDLDRNPAYHLATPLVFVSTFLGRVAPYDTPNTIKTHAK
jgi:hypothetical protein